MKTPLIAICISSFLGVASAAAKPWPFPKAKCASQAKELITKWEATNEWRPVPSENANEPVFQAPTSRTGAWVQVQKDKDGRLYAVKIAALAQIGVSWSGKNCQLELKTSAKSFFPDHAATDFTDEKLASLLSTGRPGVIFLWSPGMPYSLKAVQNIKEAAKSQNVALTFVLDSKAELKTAQAAAKDFGLSAEDFQKNRSVELIMRNTEIHFPCVIAYSHGRLSKKILPGYALPSLYEKFIGENAK